MLTPPLLHKMIIARTSVLPFPSRIRLVDRMASVTESFMCMSSAIKEFGIAERDADVWIVIDETVAIADTESATRIEGTDGNAPGPALGVDGQGSEVVCRLQRMLALTSLISAGTSCALLAALDGESAVRSNLLREFRCSAQAVALVRRIAVELGTTVENIDASCLPISLSAIAAGRAVPSSQQAAVERCFETMGLCCCVAAWWARDEGHEFSEISSTTTKRDQQISKSLILRAVLLRAQECVVLSKGWESLLTPDVYVQCLCQIGSLQLVAATFCAQYSSLSSATFWKVMCNFATCGDDSGGSCDWESAALASDSVFPQASAPAPHCSTPQPLKSVPAGTKRAMPASPFLRCLRARTVDREVAVTGRNDGRIWPSTHGTECAQSRSLLQGTNAFAMLATARERVWHMSAPDAVTKSCARRDPDSHRVCAVLVQLPLPPLLSHLL